MKFGPAPVNDAIGCVLAHSVEAGLPPYSTQMSYRIRKGTVITAAHVADLTAEGRETLIVAQLDPTDMDEDTAAATLGAALIAGHSGLYLSQAATGRVNVFAAHAGVATIDVAAIAAFNAINPMITVATVLPFQRMDADGMVATIKIIAYGVPRTDVDRAAGIGGAFGLAAPRYASATLIETRIDQRATLPDKGRHVTQDRIARFGMQLSPRVVVDHDVDTLAKAIMTAQGDMILILTGSATSDPMDVGPEALRRAGGTVMRFGMPVDPGNLLFLGALGGKPVIGLPGCARSPALNGADWILERVICGIPLGADDIAAMGVGGLLKEIPTRPRPRNTKV